MFVLDDLWIGNILPNEKAPISQNYKDTLLRVVEKEDAILEGFPDDTGKKLFESFKDCQSDLVYWAELRAFTEGFRLGGKIIMDLFDIKR